ncbi:MAG: glycerate kinase [Oscillospiraceae bacterium]|nr:glycerate kinase [Oscillospiraceae bacterium]
MKSSRKYVLIPDSFKETMSSSEVCQILAEQILRFEPDARIVSIPVADGGEGSTDAFLSAIGGEKAFLDVQGPYGEIVQGFYGRIGKTAIVEIAAAAGLPLVGENRHAEKTSTFGAGQLIAAAIRDGAERVIVGLGGSATNDGGCGAAAAFGVKFLDSVGKEFVPVGETLRDIVRIDVSEARFGGAEIITMCDIDNPLCGENGAAAVFGPQKGADADIVKLLDEGLCHLADIIERDIGKPVRDIPGAGAAGGLVAGMAAFFGSNLQMGIEVVLDTVGFDGIISDADLIITGEGRLDSQSLRGKVVIGVARRAKKQQKPVVAIVGDIVDPIDGVYGEGVSCVLSTNRMAVPFSESKQFAKRNMALTAEQLMRISAALTQS